MEVHTDFKHRFYNLEGVHHNERKKNFAKLLNAMDPEDLSQHLDIKPRNYLEKIFYVDILIYTKQVDKLVEVLKEGNGVLTSRILKQKWFFEESLKNLSEAAIVNDLLPTLSYSLRMKVLKKMSLTFDEQRMDNIFDYVVDRYGMFMGQQFLFSCSSSKIINVLKNNKVTLSVEQLKRILDKDYNLVKIYLDEYRKNTGQPFADYNFLSYIPWKYPNLYFEFQPYYQDFVKIGRQTTKTILKINTSEVLKAIDKFQRNLNISYLARKVPDFDKNYLSQNFPAKISCVESDTDWRIIAKSLRKYPHKKRWQVFSRAFTQAYNEDPINHLKIISENMIEMFPNDIKEKWAEIQFRETNNFIYIKFFDAKKAFALVKERLNLTFGFKGKAKMLGALIKLCHTKKDYDSYEKVLKYIVARHRNDVKALRCIILDAISKNIDYKLSTETFWNYVNQLIDFRVKRENVSSEISCQYLTFAVKRNLPLEEPIVRYIKDSADRFSWGFYYFDEDRIKGQIMHQVMKFLHVVEQESRRETLTICLMDEIVKLNDQHPDFVIDLNECPDIVELVTKMLAKDHISNRSEFECVRYLVQNNYSKKYQRPLKVCEESKLFDMVKKFCLKENITPLNYACLDILKQPRTTEFEHNVLDFYFTQNLSAQLCYSCGYKDMLSHFMAEEPQIIVKYFDHILRREVLLDPPSLSYTLIKLYSHLALDEKLIAYFKPLVATSSTCKSKIQLIRNLSKVMSTNDFVCLAQEYIPEKSKLDMEDFEQKSLYEAQCVAARSLRNLDEYATLMTLLGIFFQGDYLQSSLPVLCKVLYRVNEQQATSFINVLTHRAVSARKHAVFLSFEVLSQKNALDVFDIVSAKETDVSVKKYIFRALLKYFLKNPSEQLLERVLAHMTFVQKDDEDSLKRLLGSINKMPINFRPVFVEQLWDFLDAIEKEEVNVLEYRSTLLDTINSYDVTFFSAIQENFCRNVIKNHFFSNEDVMLRNGRLYDFAAKYLLAHKDREHFKFLFDILQDYKNLYWASNKGNVLKFINTFFKRVYKKYMKHDVEFVKLFTTHWEQAFTQEESFSEFVLLRLMVLYKETTNIGEFAKSVSKIFADITNEYGPYMTDILYDCIVTFFSIDDEIYDEINFALHLLDLKNEINCFIASNLIISYKYDDDDDRYFRVFDALKTVDRFDVRVHRNNMLRNWCDRSAIHFGHI